jgi:hypothetical protein
MAGSVLKAGDLLDHLRPGRHQIAGGGIVFYFLRICREFTECARADQVGPTHRLDESLDAVPHPSFPDGLYQSLIFEKPDVVVDLLPGHPDSPGQTSRRVRLAELAQYFDPKRMKRGGRRSTLVDDVYRCGHGQSVCVKATNMNPAEETNRFVKTIVRVATIVSLPAIFDGMVRNR